MSKIAIVQPVSKVATAKLPLPEITPKQAIEALVRSKVEACSEYHGKFVSSEIHPFVASVHAAFNDHRPLVLSPDMLWLLIAQGLSRHVNASSDELRGCFVQHDGKQKLSVRRDDFVKGSPENPWSDVLGEFSVQIKEHIGDENHSNIVASFSTTGAVEKAAYEVVLMESLKSYFEYQFHTLCGIPEVKLEGTAEDWNELPKRAEVLGRRYDLEWWTERIIPTLERIARNAAGTDDPQLWNNIYKLDHSSGGPYINGWIVDFFPYLQTTAFVRKASGELSNDWKQVFANQDDFRKERIEKRNWLFSDNRGHGITTESLPGSLCAAPFLWKYLDREYEMEFVAGFIGFTQSAEDLAVRPKIGWAVREV
jgi:hypothetical protein